MAKVHWTLEETEEVVRRAEQEGDESARVATGAALYLLAACLAIAATWSLACMLRRLVRSVWHFYTVRRPIERAKKRE
jgi:uncharacterized protein (DUF2267 family)